MHRRRFPAAGRRPPARVRVVVAAAAALALGPVAGPWSGLNAAQAQTVLAGQGQPTLRQAFDAAWSRQPQAQALAARREAAQAQTQAAQAWTPEPPALALASKTDRLNRNLGTREFEAGLAIPLWLPGERERSRTLADAEARAIESHAAAARLRTAASLREAWWAWQRSLAELDAARAQLDSLRRLAADVGKRLRAGDLARADQHQAEAAVAGAEAVAAQAEGLLLAAQQQLRALTGLPAFAAAMAPGGPDSEPEPSLGAWPADDANGHAQLQALEDRAAVAEGTAALEATRSRASPELSIAVTRERGAAGEAHQQTITVGLRLPFGAGPRHAARVASARSEVLEAQAQRALEQSRLVAEAEAARLRTDSARLQLAAADRRARLARQTRGFFDKSFQLGETDLPTRLRIEAEAADADRQAARARIELAAAISAWRQALGLLPQ